MASQIVEEKNQTRRSSKHVLIDGNTNVYDIFDHVYCHYLSSSLTLFLSAITPLEWNEFNHSMH